MSLHYRRRGETWHCYGTVRVGTQTIRVAEFSTGQRTLALAESAGSREEARIRDEALDGPKARKRVPLIAEAIAAYVSRPKGVKAYDVARLDDFNERIGSRPVTEAKAAWADWLKTRGKDMKPSTAARSRAILTAALNYGADHLDYPAVVLPSVGQERVEGAVYLTVAEQNRLLASYNRWAWPVIQVLCFQGLRSQEALQLDWRQIDLMRGTLTVAAERAKSGKGRTVPLHWRVRWSLAILWAAMDRPEAGPVFYSHRGKPYADTRGLGGNPLTMAHKTACKRAGISNFRVHDWRHHWASHLSMKGAGGLALERLAGWAGPKMTRRYAALSAEHLASTIDLLD